MKGTTQQKEHEMKRRIYFSATHSRGRKIQIPAYAMHSDDCPWIEDITAAIERKSGMVAITCREDGYTPDAEGEPATLHYQITLGHNCPGGGYTPITEMYVFINAAANT